MAPKAKAKPQKMGLGDFLGDQTLGSWADEMEDALPVSSGRGDARTGYGGGERRAFSSNTSFGGADRTAGFARMDPADRPGFARQALPLPDKPPYTVHLGNLSYEVSNLDVEDFFSGCEVSNVRIVEDKIERKPKGFGYVEFRSLEGLKKALELDGSQFQGRNIRISVAEPPKDRAERPEGRVLDDWSRKGPLPDLPQQQRRTSERGGFDMERGGSRRGAGFDNGPPRELGNWERRGPLSPSTEGPPPARGPRAPREGEVRERRPSPNWAEARDGSRPPPREFKEAREAREPRPIVERQPTAADMDNQWRARMKPDAPPVSDSPTPEPSAPTSPAQPSAPASRPRLNLQKRTVSEAVASPSLPTSDPSKPNPFGDARAVDTSAREQEAMEKRELALRQKKEADEKAREDRKAEIAAREVTATEKSDQAEEGTETNGEAKENGNQARPGYQILSRTEEEGADANSEATTAVEDNANGQIIEDKAVKPREVTRDPPTAPRGRGDRGPRPDRGERAERGERGERPERGERSERGAPRDWRRKTSNPQGGRGDRGKPAPESTADQMEDDGWSTVPTKGQRSGRGRGGNAGARAIAS